MVEDNTDVSPFERDLLQLFSDAELLGVEADNIVVAYDHMKNKESAMEARTLLQEASLRLHGASQKLAELKEKLKSLG